MDVVRRKWPIFIILFLIAFSYSTVGFSESIKQRMKKRLDIINQLKKAGIVGETNQGFLAYIGEDMPNQDLIAEENSDRKYVYQAIAKKEKTNAILVGEIRAKKIAQAAGKGEWLQDDDGTWYQK
jgi:uncharacterized protein YdbL (DUF1318 family)